MFKKGDKVRLSKIGLEKGLDRAFVRHGNTISTTGRVYRDQSKPKYVSVEQSDGRGNYVVPYKFKKEDWELDG